MSVVLLSNVGLRDVLLEGKPIRPARIEGEKVLRAFDAQASALSLPMLLPMVEYAYDRHRRAIRPEAVKITVVLYGTDQPLDAAPEHRDQDTIHLAEVAGKLLGRRHGDRVEQVRVKPIRGHNPSLYNDMLAFFRDQLSGRQEWVRQVEACYVCPVGGVPAANTGLMLAAIERFGERCHTLYLPDGGSRPIPMGMETLMRRSVARWMALDRLKAQAFVEALPLLEEVDAPNWVVGVARYAASRYHFDFDSADKYLEEQAIPGSSGDRKVMDRCCELAADLAALRAGDDHALLREVYHNARVAHQQGEYAGFLGRVFRFQESVLRHLVKDLYQGLSTEVDDEASSKKFRQAVRAWPDLEAHLTRLSLDYGKATRPVLEAMALFALGKPRAGLDAVEGERHRTALGHLGRLDCLSTLRNKSLIAHGFEGVSAERIRAEYVKAGHTGSPLEDMAACLESLGIPVGESPFEQAAGLIVQALGES